MSNSRKRRKQTDGAPNTNRPPHPGFAVFCNGELKADQNAESRYVGRSEMPVESLAALARTSYGMGKLFQPILNQHAAKQLVQHVLLGEKDQAEAMIKANPALLRIVATAKDHAGRTIKATPLRAALGARDVSIGEHEEMAEMIMRHMRESLDDGETEIEKQIAAQFPEGWEQEEAERVQADTDALNQVFTAIGASTTDDELKAAVAVFQVYLAQQKERVIKTGYHFNEQLFEEALDLYDYHYDQFDDFDSPKNRAAGIKVIGGIEGIFTANLAQAACDGFGKVVDKKSRLSRSLMLSRPIPKTCPFFHPNLGQSHFVYSYYGEDGPAAVAFGHAERLEDNYCDQISDLISGKSSKLAAMMQPQSTPWCVVQ